MIKPKKKICKGCGEDRIIFSKGLCATCARIRDSKPLKKTIIKKISQKQKGIHKEYSKERDAYLTSHPNCEIKLAGCTFKATEIHHSSKKRTKKDWLDTSKFISTCSNCHRKVENNPTLAKELGIYNYKA